MELSVDPHPLLSASAFVTTWPKTIGQTPTFVDLADRFENENAPMVSDDLVKTTVRDLLRVGGFKPTGRNKPASEYLLKARENGRLGNINAAVDACNVASLHSGLPISVVDLDRTEGCLRLGLAAPETRYVFNPSGQEIDVSGLLCLHDVHGPCGGPVKDSQRTKTHPETQRTLSIIWGTTSLAGRTQATEAWYTSLVEELGGEVQLILPAEPSGQLG